MGYSTVYGPVPSWRLGLSLGIDPIGPPKTCTFNCVYCQLGPTVRQVSSPLDLRDSVRAARIVGDLGRALRRIDLRRISFVTFSGSGEPTLNLHLGGMIDGVKEVVGDVPVAVLTNSSLMYRPDVRAALSKADLVVAKLDSADESTFRGINRPALTIGLDRVIDGIRSFKEEGSAFLAIQVMFIDSDRDAVPVNFKGRPLRRLLEVISDIGPDQVQINTPTRPPSEPYIRRVGRRGLGEIYDEVAGIVGKEKVLLVTSPRVIGEPSVSLADDLIEGEVIRLLERRPCSAHDISLSLDLPPQRVRRVLRDLSRRGLILSRKYARRVFFYSSGRSTLTGPMRGRPRKLSSTRVHGGVMRVDAKMAPDSCYSG